MWNRRDLLTVTSAALATFTLTLALSLPRLAVAVNDQPPATANIKIPTLTLDHGTVTAALDKSHPHTLILTLRNTSDSDAQLQFSTSVALAKPASVWSRTPSMSHQIWRQEIALDLEASETRDVTLQLPDAAFQQPDQPPVDPRQTTPGNAVVFLSRPNGMIITALTLWTGKTADVPAMPPSPLPAPTQSAP